MAPPSTVSTVQRASAASDFGPLLKKCRSEDADIRYMVLADMASMLLNSPPNILVSDTQFAPDLVLKVAELVDDANGDVQNQALKTVGPLANKLGPDHLKEFLARLVFQITSKSVDTSIYITAARTAITSLPRPTTSGSANLVVEQAYSVIRAIVIPRLTGQAVRDLNIRLTFSDRGLLELGEGGTADTEGIELAHQVITCYGVMLQEAEKKLLLVRLLTLLDDSRPSVIAQKKAVSAISYLSLYLNEPQFYTELISGITSRLSRSGVSVRQNRMLTTLIGSLAVTASRRLEPALDKLVPFVLRNVSGNQFETLTAVAQDDGADVQQEEVVEASLTTLEELFAFCSKAILSRAGETIDASLRFLAYDPNLIEHDDDDDMADDDDDFGADDDDDDFEDDDALSDSDDFSWKIRRCAAKVLHAAIRASGGSNLLESGVLYDQIAPVLIKRFNEREESVRLEIIAAVALLIRRTADATTHSFQTSNRRTAQHSTVSRKRRRSSTVQPSSQRHIANDGQVSPRASPSPTLGPQGDLARLAPRIATAAIGVYKQKTIPSKQAATSMLRDLILARQGKLNDQLGQILPATIELASTLNTSLGGSAVGVNGASAATGTTLRITCLQLLAAACDNHSSQALEPYMAAVTNAAVTSARDKHFKIAAESVHTLVSIIRALTPPRSLGAAEQSQSNLSEIFEVLYEQARSNSIELEVRLEAIGAIGVLLSRTASRPKLLPNGQRQKALDVLSERLKNEVTRLATIDAIDTIASGPITSSEYPSQWLQTITLALANQLRKADRTLSSNSLSTLNNILSQDGLCEMLGDKTSIALVQLLLPSLDGANAGQLTVTLLCISQLLSPSNIGSIDTSLYKDITKLAATPISRSPFYAYLDLVEAIGQCGTGKPLLGLLMALGIGGSIEAVGSAVGTLLAVSTSDLGVNYQDIAAELQSSKDNKRRALALTVLGQYGQCLGEKSPLSPRDFLPYLDGSPDVSRAAALALGRAGSANTSVFFPVILNELKKSNDLKRQSALLPAVKEILIKSSSKHVNISSQADELWEILMTVAASEDNRAIGAECVGKLAVIDPAKFVPKIQDAFHAGNKERRALIIQALRFALADSKSDIDEHIRPVIAPLLTAMLRDDDLDNRRLALMTLNAAFSTKPAVVSPHLGQLVLIVVERSRIDPKLVREVQMGPFKHKVDDGLDIRKSAYETLHSLIDTAYSRIDSAVVMERIIDGLGDDHDIKILCALIVSKMVSIDKQQVGRHLHEIGARFTATVQLKLKDTAVKQEIERATESQRDALKASLIVNAAFGNGADVDPNIWIAWQGYMDMLNTSFKPALAAAEALLELR